MREAASRGFFLGSKAPFGYKRVKISDGAKERPTLKVDPATAPIVKEIFESSLRGNGLKEICKELNDRGITNRGKRWYKGGLHYLLTNEAYTGTAVWGRTAKGEQAAEPVRVAKAWKPLVSRRLFESVQQALHERAPVAQRPARVGSKFLLSGLLRCGVCGRPYIGQGAKSGQYGYYICGTLYREGAGTCEARYLNAPRVEGFIIDKIKERILTDGTITELVTLVAEEIDAMAGEMNGRLKVIWAELADVESRLENLYEALETKQLTMDALSPRILSLRHRQDQLTAAREEAASLLEQRRVDLPGTEEIKGYVADFREFLQEGTFPERKALIRNFVKGIEVTGDEAVLTYTFRMVNERNQTQYYLVYGTKHHLGMRAFKDAAWSVAEDGKFEFSDLREPSQVGFLREVNEAAVIEDLQRKLVDSFKGRSVTIAELREYRDFHPTARTPHLNRALTILEYETTPPRIVDVTKADGSRRTARTHPPGCTITFAP